ncbi:MFS transporter [Parvularcula sp. ZS-1/3]|uniref:MFS transporter n=1 Tax=Parvularcula mediterranea TaxID=2732508 RepID=A0A7Y3RK14_9PROT|nr:MFS transporter [Parvularcula mediterranea]NNU15498.1 MFS transporter [Parvularcula mediterranea]
MSASRNQTDEAPIPWLSLTAAIAAISVAGMGFGHSLPLFSVLLETYGASDFEIGLNTAVAAIASLIGAPYYPRIIERIGLRPFLLIALAVMVTPYLLVYLAGDQIIWWYPLRFIFSVGGGALFAGSEIWINAATPDRIRGRVIGLYGTCLALGFALGPLVVDQTGYQGWLPFVVGAGVFSLAAIPLAIAKSPGMAEKSEGNIFKEMFKDRVLFGAAAMFAGVESAMLIFLPILAMEIGHGVSAGAHSLTIYGIGLLAAQTPVGKLCEMFSPGKVLTGCAALGAALAFAVPFVQGELFLLQAVLFLWGGAVGGIYTSGLVELGNRFKGAALSAANTGFVFTYALGAVVGPLAAGAVRGGIGPDGLLYGIALSLGLYAVAAARRRSGMAGA